VNAKLADIAPNLYVGTASRTDAPAHRADGRPHLDHAIKTMTVSSCASCGWAGTLVGRSVYFNLQNDTVGNNISYEALQ
jgi:hypothetical protein